jgi:hypothetical protein
MIDFFEVADVLDGAAADIMTFGFMRGERALAAFEDATQPRCAAVACHIRSTALGAAAVGALDAEVRRTYGDQDGVVNWNDAQRDRRKVVRAMRRTARKLRGASR